MHMYRFVLTDITDRMIVDDLFFYSSLVTGSTSHKLVTSDVSRILWMYYNDPVSSVVVSREGRIIIIIIILSSELCSSYVPETNCSSCHSIL